MAGKTPAADPEPEPDGDPEPTDDEDAKAWAKFAPRFKALQKETLNEWMKEHADSEPEPEPAGGREPAGRAGAAGAGRATPLATRKKREAPEPSGGSFLRTLLGS